MDTIDTLIIGAGVVGLAVARSLSAQGQQVVVLEQESHIGMHTSSRNSEVIHAGIYYPKDSLKAKFCVRGKELLYEYCQQRDIPHKRLGKLIVATSPQQLDTLDSIRAKAHACGVTDVDFISAGELAAREPGVRGCAALFSPSSGIIDSHVLLQALEADTLANGGMVLTHARVASGRVLADGTFELHVTGKADYTVHARRVVHAGGLFINEFLRAFEGFPAHAIRPLHFARGNYFSITRPHPFTHLVYPVPEAAGLGIHLTLDMAGRARFGPNVEWINSLDYEVPAHHRATFGQAIRTYWPELRDEDLQPSYSGIRPKLSREVTHDFVFDAASIHGLENLVVLYGIESPGLTSSLAIAEHVRDLLYKPSGA
jgi:L-2-hydroxyglutarate oxidase LhgO